MRSSPSSCILLICGRGPVWRAMVLALAAAGMIGLVNGAITTFLERACFRHHARHDVSHQRLDLDDLRRVSRRAASGRSLHGGFRWLALGEARLGAGDRDRVAVRAQPHSVRASHHRHRRQSRRRGGGRHQGDQHQDRNFVLCSVLGGFAGVIDAFRIGSIDPLAGGSEIMFMAIASAVIGGTLLTGGSGTRHRRAHRRAGAGDPQGRLHAQRGERLHFRHDPRRRDPRDHGGQRPADDVAGTGRRMMATPSGRRCCAPSTSRNPSDRSSR